MKKPSQREIVSALPLSRHPNRGDDPMAACNICGQRVAEDGLPLVAYRECDERDMPLDGNGALVFLATNHRACQRTLDAHPRLYAQDRGSPGAFPKLCGDCTLRRGVECQHAKLSKNGGPGLLVQISDPFKNAILCGRGGRIVPVKHAFQCEGRVVGPPNDGRLISPAEETQ